MTINQIIEMAERLNVYEPCKLAVGAESKLLKMIADIEAREREACARVCERVAAETANQGALDCAAVIRLRNHSEVLL